MVLCLIPSGVKPLKAVLWWLVLRNIELVINNLCVGLVHRIFPIGIPYFVVEDVRSEPKLR